MVTVCNCAIFTLVWNVVIMMFLLLFSLFLSGCWVFQNFREKTFWQLSHLLISLEQTHHVLPKEKNRSPGSGETYSEFSPFEKRNVDGRFGEDEIQIRVFKSLVFLRNFKENLKYERGQIDDLESTSCRILAAKALAANCDVGRWGWEIGRGGLFTKTHTEVGWKAMILVACCSHSIWSRWWFRLQFSFITAIWRRFPIWRAYFSHGLKPPTYSLICCLFWGTTFKIGLIGLNPTVPT